MYGIPAVAPTVDASPVQQKTNMDFFFTHLGEEPLQLYCPTCKTNVLTNTMHKTGLMTCLMSLLGCLVCPCLCCCLFPCFMNSMKDVLHVCPNCATQIDHPPGYENATLPSAPPVQGSTSGYPTQPHSYQQMPTQQPPPPPPGRSVVYVIPSNLRDQPTQLVCPQCKASILTQLRYESGVAAWLIAGGLCIFGFWCGCCLIPFCVDSCKGRCMIGRYKRI